MWQTSTLSVHMEGYKNCIMDTGDHDTYIHTYKVIQTYVMCTGADVPSQSVAFLPAQQLYTCMHTSSVGTTGAMGAGNPLKISRLKIRTHSSPHAGWTRCRWQDKQVVRDVGTDTDQYIFHQRQQIIRSWQESNFLYCFMVCGAYQLISSRITHPFRFLLLSTETCNSTFVLYLTSGLGVRCLRLLLSLFRACLIHIV